MASNYGARLSRPHRLVVFLVAATGMALFSASCGGSGGSGGSGGDGGNGGGDDGIVASVVIEPGTTVLPEVGASRQLRATAYDANGDPVDVEITWSSSDIAKVTVDAAGVITSQDTIGSLSHSAPELRRTPYK
ncbi:MAG: Ig-like domain-containing protein [Deltaproteobacteria bacterium]|nr:Ig-like domain-containing protein [Deltaproteobacteria bacterium]